MYIPEAVLSTHLPFALFAIESSLNQHMCSGNDNFMLRNLVINSVHRHSSSFPQLPIAGSSQWVFPGKHHWGPASAKPGLVVRAFRADDAAYGHEETECSARTKHVFTQGAHDTVRSSAVLENGDSSNDKTHNQTDASSHHGTHFHLVKGGGATALSWSCYYGHFSEKRASSQQLSGEKADVTAGGVRMVQREVGVGQSSTLNLKN